MRVQGKTLLIQQPLGVGCAPLGGCQNGLTPQPRKSGLFTAPFSYATVPFDRAFCDRKLLLICFLRLTLRHIRQCILAGEIDTALLVDLGNLDQQFVADRNLDALNTAVGSAADELGLDGYQAKVFLSILRPNPETADGQVNTFGDLDGDGVDDPLNTLENRQKAVKWQIDTQLERYRSAGYENLSLVGFYWQEEHIFGDDPDERAVIRYATDYVHSLGMMMLWIPYYQAQEFEEWKSLGFDIACLQPNYSFMSVTDPDRLDSTALQARMFGMCVEMELSAWSNRLNIERYKEYIQKGIEYGYMDSIKVYYLGIIPTDLTQALDNGDAYTSSVYKDTYLYAKGMLDESYSALPEVSEVTAPQSAEYACEGRSVTGKIEVGSDETYTIALAVSPRYGSLRLDTDGTFTYYPLDGYTGTDSFSVTAVFGEQTSEPAVITFVCS